MFHNTNQVPQAGLDFPGNMGRESRLETIPQIKVVISPQCKQL